MGVTGVVLNMGQRVGCKLQQHYDLHGPEKVPVDTFRLWALIGQSRFDPEEKRVSLQGSETEPPIPLPDTC